DDHPPGGAHGHHRAPGRVRPCRAGLLGRPGMSEGRLVVITGAARGLGRAIAQRFAEDRLVLGDVRAEQLEETAEALRATGTRVHSAPLDVADRSSVSSFARVVEELGGADVLVNNAAKADGVGGDSFWELDEERFEELVQINVTGTWMMSKHLVGPMLERGSGAIVN